MMLSLDTAYRSFGGEVGASSTPTICRLPDSRRHQLSAIARPLLGDSARAGSQPAHFARTGPVGAFAWAGSVLRHLAQPVLGHLVRAVRAQPAPVYLPRPPKLGIASTRLQLVAD